ncbi:5'/3'-nucleotidase SurE [Albimonas sp. CAU 1670]|uniref:5'/3'-nucleotidase SurE n=1 Tax=Albimonas sp. CAU 1670 TaxID=3032599 RepID=UPI0023DAAFC5|nr:5'/3'-nucleotidase SurE [Albimonas sp. CAU 1670]MDF2231869.1 5'/3'-nucleotidase SurE [Albimonas sp. CAU 1670]
MRILITNDDGITAPGLRAAEDIALALAGPKGEVWTVAPESEQSGVAHCISYTKPMRINPLGPRRFAVDGSPADCVIVALSHIMADCPPDLILSGVNRGHNVAEDVVYSGTVGGAIEGTLARVPSIALSQGYGPDNLELDDMFEGARRAGPDAVRRVLEMPWEPKADYGLFYNINFPPVPGDRIQGIRAANQGRRPGGAFKVQETVAPNGRSYFWLAHARGNELAAEGTDARGTAEGWITVTPLRCDLTAHDRLAEVEAALSGDGARRTA